MTNPTPDQPRMSVPEAEAALAPLEAAVRGDRRAQQTGDRAALRDRIAAAIRRAPFEELRSDWGEPNGPLKITALVDDVADAVLPVVLSEPTDQAVGVNCTCFVVNDDGVHAASCAKRATDQAAVRAALREAANRLDAHMERFFAEWPDEPRTSPYALGWKDAEAELRRLADEAQGTTCPGFETVPNRCGCPCEGCKHNCAAHEPAGPAAPAKDTPDGCTCAVAGDAFAPAGHYADCPAAPAKETQPTAAALLATPCDVCSHTLNWHRNDIGCTVSRCVCSRFRPADAPR